MCGSGLAWAWALGTGVPLFGVLVVAIVGVTSRDVDTEYVSAAVLFLVVVALGAGLLATLFAAKAIAEPLTSVREGVERVERGELDTRVPVDDGSEIGRCRPGSTGWPRDWASVSGSAISSGARSERTWPTPPCATATRLGGEEREVGALFVDLVGSTSMAMAMPPTDVVRCSTASFASWSTWWRQSAAW